MVSWTAESEVRAVARCGGGETARRVQEKEREKNVPLQRGKRRAVANFEKEFNQTAASMKPRLSMTVETAGTGATKVYVLPGVQVASK